MIIGVLYVKNVWIINHYAIPPTMGGLNRHYYFSKYLNDKGYKVEIFTASKVHNTEINMVKDERYSVKTTIDGVKYNFIKTRDYRSNNLSRILNMIDFPINMYRTTARFNPPDIIYSSSPSPLACVLSILLANRYKCKLIVEIRDLWPESIFSYGVLRHRNGLLARMLFQGEKWIYKKADRLFFTMEGGKDYIVEKGWSNHQGGPIDLNKIYHINNGVDLEMFNYNKQQFKIEDPHLKSDKFKIIYVGSVRLANKLEMLLEAAKIIRNKNIIFLIWGNGDRKRELQRRVKLENIDNVVFKGFIEKKYVPHILSKSNLNIISGEQTILCKYGLSLNKMFDYFGSGKPTLSNMECGYDLLKKYNCGLTVNGGSTKALVEGIMRFYTMPEYEYQTYCSNALKAAKDYDYKRLSERVEEVLLELA